MPFLVSFERGKHDRFLAANLTGSSDPPEEGARTRTLVPCGTDAPNY